MNYVRDVQAPQVRAIVEDFDESIAATLRAATFVNEVSFTPGTTDDWSDPRKVARRAKRLLDSSYVPASGRYWLVGAAISEKIATVEQLLEVDTSGLPEALRDGVVGRLSGFTIVDWPTLADDESFFVHNTAVAISAVAPVVPNGAKAGATIADTGLAVTQVWDYQSATMADQSTVHAFTGANLVTDPHVVTATEAATGGTYEGQQVGAIALVDDEPVLEFVRAVKVNYTAPSGE